jgi:hypothetical protein
MTAQEFNERLNQLSEKCLANLNHAFDVGDKSFFESASQLAVSTYCTDLFELRSRYQHEKIQAKEDGTL